MRWLKTPLEGYDDIAPPGGKRLETTYPINLDNKNYVDFIATVAAWGVTNHVYTFQIMSKQ